MRSYNPLHILVVVLIVLLLVSFFVPFPATYGYWPSGGVGLILLIIVVLLLLGR